MKALNVDFEGVFATVYDIVWGPAAFVLGPGESVEAGGP